MYPIRQDLEVTITDISLYPKGYYKKDTEPMVLLTGSGRFHDESYTPVKYHELITLENCLKLQLSRGDIFQGYFAPNISGYGGKIVLTGFNQKV